MKAEFSEDAGGEVDDWEDGEEVGLRLDGIVGWRLLEGGVRGW